MSAPLVLEIPEWEWVLVATNVVTGTLDRLEEQITYYYTYRDTAEPAPDAIVPKTLPEEAVKIFVKTEREYISGVRGLDIYVMCANNNDDVAEIGKIRVNL